MDSHSFLPAVIGRPYKANTFADLAHIPTVFNGREIITAGGFIDMLAAASSTGGDVVI